MEQALVILALCVLAPALTYAVGRKLISVYFREKQSHLESLLKAEADGYCEKDDEKGERRG